MNREQGTASLDIGGSRSVWSRSGVFEISLVDGSWPRIEGITVEQGTRNSKFDIPCGLEPQRPARPPPTPLTEWWCRGVGGELLDGNLDILESACAVQAGISLLVPATQDGF